MKKVLLFASILMVLLVFFAACDNATPPAKSDKPASEGLAFKSNGDGTCYVAGIGTCTDTDLVIPKSSPEGDKVIAIGVVAFEDCHGLTSIVIPDSVTSIDDRAFEDCIGLTSIVIPDSVTSIGPSAFNDCIALTSIAIPVSVTSIGNYAFYGCSGVTSITVEEGNSSYHSDGNCLIETKSKTVIVGCSTSVTPTDGSVTSIGKSAFGGRTSLTSIVIPDSVTSIGDAAFINCTDLTSVVIGNGVTDIGFRAFDNCIALTSIVIPNSVTSIGDDAFKKGKGLISVTFKGTVAQWNKASWKYRIPATKIICSDGVVTLD